MAHIISSAFSNADAAIVLDAAQSPLKRGFGRLKDYIAYRKLITEFDALSERDKDDIGVSGYTSKQLAAYSIYGGTL